MLAGLESNPTKNVRLIYEQIEAPKAHLLKGGVLDCRLALILLDNVAELWMVGALKEELGCRAYSRVEGLPFLDTYRTFGVAPGPGFGDLLEGMRTPRFAV